MSDDNSAVVSKASEFRTLNRTKLNLPSGLVVEIRKLTGMDFLAMGTLPAVAAAKKGQERGIEDVRKHYEENPDALVEQHRTVLCAAFVSPVLVNAPPHEIDEAKNELSVYEITDVDYLVTEILKFSGLTEEAALKAGKFPAESGLPASGLDGSAVSSSPE